MNSNEIITACIAIAISSLVAFLIVKWPAMQRRGQNTLLNELENFLGSDPNSATIVERQFTAVELPNLHLAMESYVARTAAKHCVIGYSSENGFFAGDLRSLLHGFGNFTQLGPVVYSEVDVDVDQQLQCVQNGLHLIESSQGKLAAHVRRDVIKHDLQLEVLSESPEFAARFLEEIRKEISDKNVYRGKIITLESQAESCGYPQSANIRFHVFPKISRDEIILPEKILDLIERNTVQFYRHADALRKADRSVKRGLLLHGKPGTGKTYTVKWLAGSLPGVTVILLSGEQLWHIKQCCQMARMLAPALVIMEDVDLIASHRDGQQHPLCQSTLHQLLNEMDGLAADAAVMFILTTNRVEEIETALAARPGRVDQVIEYPLPDADCRKRLLELYGRGLHLDLKEPEKIIAKTQGASPAFIQELLRKSALLAAEENSFLDGLLHVRDGHIEAALRELVFGAGPLMRQVLGFTETNCE